MAQGPPKELQVQQFAYERIPVGASIMIIGKRHSGKSAMQYAIMEAMSDKFKLAFGLSPTIAAKQRFRQCMPNWCVFDLSIDNLQKICTYMKRRYDRQVVQKRVPDQWLLVLDDTAFDEKFMKSTVLKEVFANGRNFGCTIMVIVQYIKAAPPIMRTNSDYVICFWEDGEKERKMLHEQYFSCIPKFEFERVFKVCTENYAAMICDKRVNSRRWQDKISWKRAHLDLPEFKIGSPAMFEIDKRCFIANPDLEADAQNVLLLDAKEGDKGSGGGKAADKGKKKRHEPSNSVVNDSDDDDIHRLMPPEGDGINLDDFDFDD